MNETEITAKIETDISEITEYREELRTLLTPPVLEQFEGMDGVHRQLWIIGKRGEYFLTFNDVSGGYGLAYRTILNEPVALGEEGDIGEVYKVLVEC